MNLNNLIEDKFVKKQMKTKGILVIYIIKMESFID